MCNIFEQYTSVMDMQTDGQTDKLVIAYTALRLSVKTTFFGIKLWNSI